MTDKFFQKAAKNNNIKIWKKSQETCIWESETTKFQIIEVPGRYGEIRKEIKKIKTSRLKEQRWNMFNLWLNRVPNKIQKNPNQHVLK